MVGDVRGMGLMQGVELVKDRQTKEPATDLANQILERTRANGLIVGKGGLFGNVVRMSPPLNIGKADFNILDLYVQALFSIRIPTSLQGFILFPQYDDHGIRNQGGTRGVYIPHF